MGKLAAALVVIALIVLVVVVFCDGRGDTTSGIHSALVNVVNTAKTVFDASH